MFPLNRGFAFFSRVFLAVTFLTVIIAVSGCGNKEPFDYVKVQGKVSYEDGSLIPAGQIYVWFISQTQSRDPKITPRKGVADVDVKTGMFTIVTSHNFGDGIVPGDHKVLIMPPQPGVPVEYTSVDTTPLTVNSKDSPFDLKIKKPAGRK